MDKGDNPYKLLGVDPKADYDTIKKAYRKLAIKMHPDKGGDPSAFAKIAHANEVVSDPKQRHNYDLQQQKSNRGWDPQAPEFTTTSDDYDPTKNPIPASPRKNTRTTTTSTQSFPSQTYTTYEYPQKFTTSKPKTTTRTYTTTTTSSTPTKHHPTNRTTTQTTKSFASPSSPTKTKRTTTNSQSFSSPTSSMNKGMGKMSLSGDDEDIKGMSSSTKTITHPNGQKELITETIITRFDGTKETRRESKMVGGPTKTTTSSSSSKPMQTMKSPMSTKPKVVTKMTSPKTTKMTTTTTSSKPSTTVKKSPTKTITHSTTATTTSTASVPKKSPTKKVPRKAALPSGGTTAKVFRNGKLISTTTMS